MNLPTRKLFLLEMLDNKIKIEFAPPDSNYHYEITPYTFAPRVGKRLVSKTYLDLNQGILDMIYELYKQIKPSPLSQNKVIKRKKK